ncbi:amidase [Nocardia salmonicida]|uniref:amidase n=1 Tax=Nocardia salmonicida TaxID=53431 RepID=UPI003788A229
MVLPFSWPEWQRLDATALAEHIRTGQTTAAEVATQAATAIERADPRLHAVLEVFDDVVEDPTRELPPSPGQFAGVPMLIKDSGSGMRDRLREWGSRVSVGQRPTADCPVTANLRQGGFVLLGRTRLPESGKTFDTTTDYCGSVIATRNPWDLAKTPGGSSGGSAAMVAAGAVPIARAGDAAGSTRVPAAFTGLVGHKPSRGLLPPPLGTSELTNHRIQEGVLTRTVRDQAAALDIMIRGYPMSHFIAAPTPPTSFAQQIRRPPRQLRIAVSTGQWGRPGRCCEPVARQIVGVASVLADTLGHQVEMVGDDQICEWEPFWDAVETNWLATSWFWRAVAAQRGWPVEQIRSLLTPQNANLLDAGEHLTIADLGTALAANPRLMASLARFFDRFDVLACPVFPDPAPDAGGPYSLLSTAPFATWLDTLLHGMRYTVLGNESGLPSISVPTGLLDGMPTGILFYGRPHSDGLVLQLAAQLERTRPEWFATTPPMLTDSAR